VESVEENLSADWKTGNQPEADLVRGEGPAAVSGNAPREADQ
jgi:hypothetical protein